MARNENKPVCSEEIARPPMKYEELRARFKHIAGLCWGLSIDLANEIELRETVTADRDRLANENEALMREIRELTAKLNSRKSASNAYRKKTALQTANA